MENNIPNNDPTGKNEQRSQELDAKELIRKHIEDPEHEITDDDIRNLKPAIHNDPPTIGAEAMSRIAEIEEDEDEDDEDEDFDESDVDDNKESEKPTTPWDVRND